MAAAPFSLAERRAERIKNIPGKRMEFVTFVTDKMRKKCIIKSRNSLKLPIERSIFS